VSSCRKTSNEITFVSTSITNSLHPPSSRHVRANLAVAAWILKEISKNVIQMYYLVKVDIGGSVPSAVIKIVSKETPTCVRRIEDYLIKYGPPPKVLPSFPWIKESIEFDNFSLEKGIYEIKFRGHVHIFLTDGLWCQSGMSIDISHGNVMGVHGKTHELSAYANEERVASIKIVGRKIGRWEVSVNGQELHFKGKRFRYVFFITIIFSLYICILFPIA